MDQVANKQKTKIKTNQDQVKINGLHLVQVLYWSAFKIPT